MRPNREILPFYLLLLLAATMPFGWAQGLAAALFVVAVLLCQPLAQTVENVRKRPLAFLFMGTYLLYVLAMAYTENTAFGMRDLTYKLSLLVFPLALAAMPRLSQQKMKIAGFVFVGACFAAAISALGISSFRVQFDYLPRYIELSVFMHPGYFSAYLNLCFVLLFFLLKSPARKRSVGLYAAAIFIVLFNLLLESKMGIITNIILLFLMIFQSRRLSRKLILIAAGTTAIIFVVVLSQVSSVMSRFENLAQVLDAVHIPKDSNESTALRILIWDQALKVFKEHPWIGVGTGDTKDVMVEQYRKNGIVHAYELRLNAHNQYLEWLLTFGIIGTAVWLLAFAIPIREAVRQRNPLYLYFTLIILLAFVAESFLEREAGIVFYSFFNGLLVFHGR